LQKSLYKYRITEKPSGYYKKQNLNHYIIGFKYLNEYYREKNGDYYYRMGLLEYYRGSMKLARKNLLRSLKFKNIKKIFIFRYLLISLLGNGIVGFLRNKKILSTVNILIKNNFNYDTYSIEGTKIKK
jgi:hypothetical protein